MQKRIEQLKTVFYQTRKIFYPRYIKRPFVNYLIYNYNKPLVGCEIGVEYGIHAEQMCWHLNIKELYLIDPYIESDEFPRGKIKNKNYQKWDTFFKQVDYDDAYNIAKKRLRHYPVIFVKEKSIDAVKCFDDDFFDFVFIDGNLKIIKEDIYNYYPKVKDGGLFGGHDFDAEKTIVNEAVISFTKEKNLLLRGGNNEWWVKKGEVDDVNFTGKWGVNTTG